MSEPVRLEVYREKPTEIRYSKGEHAPVCRWCRWHYVGPVNGEREDGMWCKHPVNLGTTATENLVTDAEKLNDKGQCQRYLPSLGTRLMQWLRLRPWIERPR